MIIKKIKGTLMGIICLVGVHSTTTNADVIELALLLDSSGSIGGTDWVNQLNAYQSIFASGSFYDDFVVGMDTLHVTAYSFGGSGAGTTVTNIIGMSTITDNLTATTFGNQFTGQTYIAGGTPTEHAVIAAAGELLNNMIVSDRMIIDISTDGLPCQTPTMGGCGVGSDYYDATLAALTTAAAAGINTNFIGIGSQIDHTALGELATAGNGFWVPSPDFTGFQGVLAEKLFREINVPAPATLALFGLGLVGLGFGRRKG